jgi:aminoglycoside phosphotransferase (APT) family kinase protein
VETGRSVLGEPFLAMERIEGQVPSDDPPYTVAGWVSELTGAQRSAMFDGALRRLVEIHQVDWRGLGLGFLDRPRWGSSGIEQQLGYLDDLAGYALKGRPNPVVDAALAWTRGQRAHGRTAGAQLGRRPPGQHDIGARPVGGRDPGLGDDLPGQPGARPLDDGGGQGHRRS